VSGVASVVQFPEALDDVEKCTGTFRAGGTDLTDLRRRGLHDGPVVDLSRMPELREIERTREGGLRIGALVTVAELATDERVIIGYPGLAQAAAGLATPQIRARATVGGNLLQDVRCWYFRTPEFVCAKKGGDACFARTGDHLYHSIFDLGPCIAPHPSTLACALLAFGAMVEVHDDDELRTVRAVVGNGKNPTQSHTLKAGELLAAIELPPPVVGERSAYFRAITRSRSEWPLAEVVVRLEQDDAGVVVRSQVTAGGVANVPIPLKPVMKALTGSGPDGFEAAAATAAAGARPFEMNQYKTAVLAGAVLEALERAAAGTPAERVR
jgi:xanthine dehydrogenase YagS FAD-binding subunit